MAKNVRHLDGFVPSGMLLEVARRNPGLRQLTKSLATTESLWSGSDARRSQLFRFMGAGNGDRFVYDAQNGTSRPGILRRKEGDPEYTQDSSINESFDHLGIIRDYYRIVHGRNSIDANGMALRGVIHFDQDYDNAFWDGQYMTAGDGDRVLFLTFLLLNVWAHEMTHGVTEYAVPGGIEYYGMWGSNNEHLSDVGGANVESWFLKQSAKQYHWLVGKGIWVPAPAGSKAIRRALRDMLNPGTAYKDPQLGKDRQPGHMKDYVKTSSDNGGVHTNSGIPNRLYALFATGIEEAGLGNDWESTIGKAAKIWYAARPSLGNTPSFGQLAYWALEACALYPDEESKLRDVLMKAANATGIKPDRKAIDDLTPKFGDDE